MLKEIFVSEVRLKILKLLVLNPDRNFHVRAIVRAVSAEINAVRRELEKLIRINLLRRRQSSNRIYYTVNSSHPFYTELLYLLSKEDGFGAEIIKNAKLLGDIEFAMIAGSFLRGRQSTALDVDLFIVGDVKLDLLKKLVVQQEAVMSREVNYSVMTKEEFKLRKRTNDPFVAKILTQSRAMLIGDEEKFYPAI
jgi:predicted nucleotidyltransferase